MIVARVLVDRMDDVADTVTPSLRHSPAMRRQPQRGLSRASRSTSLTTDGSGPGVARWRGRFSLSDQLAMPAQQRRRRDDEDGPTIAGEQLRQRGQEQAIARRVPGQGHLPAQHGELVPQNGDLDILRMGSPADADHREHPPHDEKRQGPHHHGNHPGSPP